MSHNQKNGVSKPVSVAWLRRDLRLYDHATFAAAQKSGAPVQPVFIFDTGILARFKAVDDRRLSFIAQALCHIHETLAAHQAGVLVLQGNPETLMPRICHALQATAVFAEEDYEPATRARDAEVASALQGKTEFRQVKDHLILALAEVLKPDGTPYKVFTPYAKAWRQKARKTSAAGECPVRQEGPWADYEHGVKALRQAGLEAIDAGKGAAELLASVGYRLQENDWKVENARAKLHAFVDERIGNYAQTRDFMAVNGTSRLSAYLRFGLISVRECLRLAGEEEAKGGKGAFTWINELIWRDFYAMILYYFPETVTKEFQAQYRGLKWSRNKQALARFTEGMTGYPIVDAAMRQLTSTGFMHNRARMIVASFMSKDLLLDWRLGEELFAQYLMDYELSSNVGGWQWAASVGTDAQPYFRVFNPSLQSKNFDPEGDYIRHFVPELSHLSAQDIHEPWLRAKPAGYPPPMVDHNAARGAAIALFKDARAAAA